MIGFIKRKWSELQNNSDLKRKLYVIIFENDTPMGKLFDLVLMAVIVMSIMLLFLESSFHGQPVLERIMVILEYLFTFVFTLEYLLRLYCSPAPSKYALSFFGVIDLLATLPLYLSWIGGPMRYLMIVRSLRLMRIFRVFKMFSFLNEGHALLQAILDSSRKIFVFFLFVLVMVISIGTIMFMIEGNVEGTSFKSIPSGIYWAIVTLTTVGYGDITPVTSFGRFMSAVVMLLGYTIIAVPTGIVSASISREKEKDERVCENCGCTGHEKGATHCKKCGTRLPEKK